MEDISAYIETGILELYVLGDLSQSEKLQVEEMASKHPSVKEEIAQIEKSLEAFALQNALEPADHLREKIMNSLVTNLADDQEFLTKAEHNTQAKVVPLPKAASGNFYKYAFAAATLALIASLAALFTIYGRLQESDSVIASLQSRNRSFVNQVNLLDQEIGVFHDPSIKLFKLQGTPKSPKAQMMLAWSPEKKKVMIDMQDMKLAQNDKDHQYQLWAIVNGKPVDLGVFDAKSDTTGMKEMKPVADATVFAVTMEPRGGSINPTMDQMVLAVKI